MTLIDKVKQFLSRKSPKGKQELPWRFTGRLSENDLVLLAERSLGRRLSNVELDAIERDFRPHGLISPDDSYTIRLASSRYLGGRAPLLEIYPIAMDGYADGCPKLVVSESADISFRDKYGDEQLETIVA